MLAAAMLGFQQSDSFAGGVAFGLVMARRGTSFTPWQGRELERARKVARRFKLSEDLAPFMPREPRWFWSRKDKQLYQSAIIGLKRLDALPAEERAKAIADLKILLGASD